MLFNECYNMINIMLLKSLVDSTFIVAGVEQRDNLDRGKLRTCIVNTIICKSRPIPSRVLKRVISIGPV